MRHPPQFPVIIGVTGHRQIAPHAVSGVRKSVTRLLQSWRYHFGPALHVMTALADGADQLVADVAGQLNLSIIAVAPFGRDAYRAGLADKNTFDRHWNRAVLTLELPTLLPPGHPLFNSWQYQQLGVLLIRRSHLLLGLWDGCITSRPGGTSDVMRMRLRGDHHAATFDREPMFQGARSYLDETNRGPALQIVTPRAVASPGATAGPPGGPPGTCRLLGLPPQRLKESGLRFVPGVRSASFMMSRSEKHREFVERLHRCLGLRMPGQNPPRRNSLIIDWTGEEVAPDAVLCAIRRSEVEDFDRIDAVNREIGRLRGSGDLLFRQQLGYLQVNRVPGEAGEHARFLARLQAGVDTVAQACQVSLFGDFVPANSAYEMLRDAWNRLRVVRRRPRLGAVLGFTAALPTAVILFELYVDGQRHDALTGGFWWLLVYLLVLIGGPLFFLFHVRRLNLQEQFQDHRALAEALRIQLYWALAGIPASVSDHYLHKQSGELGWIQFALRGPSLWGAGLAMRSTGPHRQTVVTGWINDQLTFFTNKAEMNRRASARGDLFTLGLLILGALSALALFALLFNGPADPAAIAAQPATTQFAWRGWLHHLRHHHGWLIVVTAALPATAALFKLSKELRHYEPHFHAYALMRRMFSRVTDFAAEANQSAAEFRAVAREVGREALAENAQWLVERRHRKVEPH